jgi:hypothetical protein
MLCLVCEKKVPLARQLAGSPFCSKEHGEQHGAQRTPLCKRPESGPVLAKFAPSSPACALLEAQPDTTAFRTPIPRFCDVILSRRHLKPRYTIGVPSARVVGWLPGAAPPGTGRAVGAGPEGWNRLQLGLEFRSPLAAARRLSTATLQQSVQVVPPPPARVHCPVDAGFRAAPWDASLRKRWPGAHWAPAGLLVARPQTEPRASASDLPEAQNRRDSQTSKPIPFPLQLASARFTHELAKPGLRALQTAFAPALKPRSVNTAPLASASASPMRPRQRIKGPGARDFAPAPVGFRPTGVAAETFLVADRKTAPWFLGFSLTPMTSPFDAVLPLAALPAAGYRGDAVPPTNSGSRLTSQVAAAIPAPVQSPSLNSAGATFTRQKPVGPRPLGAAAETFLLADRPPTPLNPGFRPPPLTSALEGPLPLAGLSLANYSGESFAMADSASKLAPTAAASITATVLLPKLQLSPALHLAPQTRLFDGAEAATALQAFCGMVESFTLADMERARHNSEPIPPRSGLWLPQSTMKGIAAPSLRASVAQVPDLRWTVLTPMPRTPDPVSFQYVIPTPRKLGKPDASEFEFDCESVWTAAGFAAEPSPSPLPGVCRPLYDSSDFSLHPVWLAALFTLGRPQAALRLGGQRNPDAIGPPARFHHAPEHAQGPGFSGILLHPAAGAPDWEFGKKGKSAATRPQAPRDPSAAKTPWHPLQDALQLWRSVPVFARGLAVAIPLLAPAMYYAPSFGSSSQGASSQGGMAAAIQARATVDLQEDFQAGLSAWTGAKGWEGTWSMASSGAAQPGRLALYRPMTPLTDYRLELQGQIQTKALGFVFRATDMNNYYAAKIAIRKPGPLPSVYLVRYAVIEGKAGAKTETLLPMYLRNDSLYDVVVGIQGDSFTFTLNGQLVDSWSDGRLKSGGVGLFAEKGEVSHIRSVHVTENVDFLGWVCSQVSHWNADRARIGVKHE